MKKGDFEKYLAVYGAELRQWPATLQQAAEDALRESKELQELLAAETAFESLLRSRPSEEAPEGLASRIIAQAQPRETNGRSWQVMWADLWAPKKVAAVAAVFVVGLLIGWYNPLNGQVMENSGLQLTDFLNYEEVNLWPEN